MRRGAIRHAALLILRCIRGGEEGGGVTCKKEGVEEGRIKYKGCVIVSLNRSSKVKQQQATGQMGGGKGVEEG